MSVKLNRRQFFKVCTTGLASSSIVALGFSPKAALAEVREFKLSGAKETRNTCPYCSVSCGVLMYSLGSNAKNAKQEIFHIEGDPDHPINRGTLCPKDSLAPAGRYSGNFSRLLLWTKSSSAAPFGHSVPRLIG